MAQLSQCLLPPLPQSPPVPLFHLVKPRDNAGFPSAGSGAPSLTSVSPDPPPTLSACPAADVQAHGSPTRSAPPPHRQSHCLSLQQTDFSRVGQGSRAPGQPRCTGDLGWAQSQVRTVLEGLELAHHSRAAPPPHLLPPNTWASPSLPQPERSSCPGSQPLNDQTGTARPGIGQHFLRRARRCLRHSSMAVSAAGKQQ